MKSRKFPKFSQWKQIFKILKRNERRTLVILMVLALGSFLFLTINLYVKNTETAPASGGMYTEGIVGQPRFINPIYGETNDVDRTLIDLIYSGLMTYDKDGKIVKDLVQDYQISEDGKTYSFQLKDNLFWQDGVPLTVEDIAYTIKTIQNSDYKSPLRASWLDVEIEKTSDKSFNLLLRAPYNSFLETCTVKIIPQHIWKDVLPESFAFSSYNLRPIGSGLYMLEKLDAGNGFIKSLSLKANRRYYNKIPHISSLSFQFFENKDELIKAANQKAIDGFSLASMDNNELQAEKEVKQGWFQNEKFKFYSFSLPRYFAVFFNTQKSKIFSDNNITKALNYSVDKQALVEKMSASVKGKISIVNSPILPEFFGYNLPTVSYGFDTEAAGKLLDKSGYKDNGSGQRVKADSKQPAFQFKSYLSSKSKGAEVTELQGCLSRLDDSFKNLLQEETSGTYGKGTGAAVTEFQKKYLPDITATGEVGPSTRKKLNELCLKPQDNSLPLKFTLTTINQPQMVRAANLLKDYWQNIGAEMDIKTVEISELKEIIKARDYDALLYGEALGGLPDPYPFWHSSQSNDPGLNLSAYQNKNADQLLKDARETLDEQIKAQKYEKLQDILINDAPALFLYNPDYLSWISGKIKGVDTTKIVDPAKRFSNIENWYIQTKRVWK